LSLLNDLLERGLGSAIFSPKKPDMKLIHH
jgi:hypothetical protein